MFLIYAIESSSESVLAGAATEDGVLHWRRSFGVNGAAGVAGVADATTTEDGAFHCRTSFGVSFSSMGATLVIDDDANTFSSSLPGFNTMSFVT